MGIFAKKHSIGKTIAQLRKQKGWTQAELAEKLNISDKAVSKWEKDNGTPSIEFFPVLSELFGVSIDFLMTGKQVDPEIVTMSKIELCAKNDDDNLFNSLSQEVVFNKDDNNKSIIDYIEKYCSKKVFTSLLTKYSPKILTSSYTTKNSPKYDNLKVLKLMFEFEKYDELAVLQQFSPTLQSEGKLPTESIYNKSIMQLIVKNPNDKQLEKYLSIHNQDTVNPKKCWLEIYNQILVIATESKNTKLIKSLLDLFININQQSIEGFNSFKENSYSYKRFTLKSRYVSTGMNYSTVYNYALIIPEYNVLSKLLDLGFIDEVKKLYDTQIVFNKSMNNDYKKTANDIELEHEIQLAELKKNNLFSSADLKELNFVYNGIINISKLLQTGDIDFIKKLLYKYPISIYEKMCLVLKDKNKEAIFEIAVDNKMPLADILAGKKMQGQKNIEWYEKDSNFCKELNAIILKDFSFMNSEYFGQWYYGHWKMKIQYNLQNYLDVCTTIRQNIIDDFVVQESFKQINQELNKEYFEKLLKAGNLELLVVKLCVKLESYLQVKKNYIGGFNVMLEKFCASFNTTDDESNDYDPHTPLLLNKLRKFRNSIVHSQDKKDNMSLEDVKKCIDYICNLS